MLRRLPLLALLLLAAGAQAAETKSQPTPPVEAPPKVEPGESIRPEVTITEGKDKTVTEYRINGQLRAVKIQPKNLPAYYLIDNEGTGKFMRVGPDTGPELVIPRWVLMEW